MRGQQQQKKTRNNDAKKQQQQQQQNKKKRKRTDESEEEWKYAINRERERMASLHFVFAVYETPQGLSNINSIKCSFTEVMLHKKRKKKTKQTNSYLTNRY